MRRLSLLAFLLACDAPTASPEPSFALVDEGGGFIAHTLSCWDETRTYLWDCEDAEGPRVYVELSDE